MIVKNVAYIVANAGPTRVTVIGRIEVRGRPGIQTHRKNHGSTAPDARQNPDALRQKRAATKRPASGGWLAASEVVELHATEQP